MSTNRLRRGTRAVFGAALCSLLASCHIVFTVAAPKPPTPFQLATSLQVVFDYTGLIVGGMGGGKSEQAWVATKTAEDPEYPKTWADLKAKWEANFMQGLSANSPVPVSRAAAAPPTAAAAYAPTASRELFAQADTTNAGAQPAPATAGGANPSAVATDANIAAPTTESAPTAAPAPAAPAPAEPPPFDGVLTVRVSLSALHLGKYIPMFTTKAEVQVNNIWLATNQSVGDSHDAVQYEPTMRTPSVFQHIEILGSEAGGRAARFLSKRHRR